MKSGKKSSKKNWVFFNQTGSFLHTMCVLGSLSQTEFNFGHSLGHTLTEQVVTLYLYHR